MGDRKYSVKWFRAVYRVHAMYFLSWVMTFVMAIFPVQEGSYPYSSDNIGHVIVILSVIIMIFIINAIFNSKRIDKMRSTHVLEERVYKFGIYSIYKVGGAGIPLILSIICLSNTPIILISLLIILLVVYIFQFPTKSKIFRQIDMTDAELEQTLKERSDANVTGK